MQAYIKRASDFRTAFLRPVLAYDDLILDSLESFSSTLSLRGGDIPQEMTGSFLSLAGSLFLISGVSPELGSTRLTVQSPLELFSRPRPYLPPSPLGSIGAFVARELAAWRDESDAVYALPYLNIDNSDATPFVPPETDETGYYVLTDYLRTVRSEHGVELLFTPDEDSLSVSIRSVSPAAHTYASGNGHTFLRSSSYSRKALAKLTTVQPVDTGTLDADGQKIFRIDSTDWYLAADGSVSSQEPAERAEGSWEVQTVSEKNDAQEAALAAFAKNSETHKLEFWTDCRPRVRDGFRLRLPSGGVFEGRILSVSRSMGDSRWLCRAGSLATTLTEKVRRAGSSGGGSSKAKAYQPGDVFPTTRDGDPALLLGYGAWNFLGSLQLTAAQGVTPPAILVWIRTA